MAEREADAARQVHLVATYSYIILHTTPTQVDELISERNSRKDNTDSFVRANAVVLSRVLKAGP